MRERERERWGKGKRERGWDVRKTITWGISHDVRDVRVMMRAVSK